MNIEWFHALPVLLQLVVMAAGFGIALPMLMLVSVGLVSVFVAGFMVTAWIITAITEGVYWCFTGKRLPDPPPDAGP